MPENNTPITDAALAELDRWLDIANQPYHAKRKAAKTHAQYMVAQLVPALRQRLTDAEAYRDEVEAAKPTVQALLDSGERAASEAADLRQRLTEAERERDEAVEQRSLARMADYADELLAARDARMKREGAAEWLRGYVIAVKLQNPVAETVSLSSVEQAAKRLREGK